jgi:hypothetical protein
MTPVAGALPPYQKNSGQGNGVDFSQGTGGKAKVKETASIRLMNLAP